MVQFYEADKTCWMVKKMKVKYWIRSIAIAHGKFAENISFIFCSDDYLLKLNKQFLDHDYYTDVITFEDTNPNDPNSLNGEIYISLDRIMENAKEFGVTVQHELLRVMAHGVLHLCGYGDKTEEEKDRMAELEDEALKMITFRLLDVFNPYREWSEIEMVDNTPVIAGTGKKKRKSEEEEE